MLGAQTERSEPVLRPFCFDTADLLHASEADSEEFSPENQRDRRGFFQIRTLLVGIVEFFLRIFLVHSK